MMNRLFFFALLVAVSILAQRATGETVAPLHQHHAPPEEKEGPTGKQAEPGEAEDVIQHLSPPAQEHGVHDHGPTDPIRKLLMQQASGTSVNPASSGMHGDHGQIGGWNLMHHGQVFVNGVVQTGPRGEDEIFSTNWLMVMADRPLGGGHFAIRGMLSLEPATISDEYYPELFQTGELADGEPIVDGQHPHDFFMELAAEYAQELWPGVIGNVYAAVHGDPALGPVAFPHRVSAMEIPQATLAHHLQDSTHIAGSVLTLGISSGIARLEMSGFHGEEPDEERWDLDTGRIDSWSVRIGFTPSPHWSAQISTGHLEDPEAHAPGDLQRTTASVLYHRPTSFGEMAHGFIWGRNDPEEGSTLDAFTLESLVRVGPRNHLTGRLEIVDRASHDLLEAEEGGHHADLEEDLFRITALTLGYVRDVYSSPAVVYGAGFNATAYAFPSELEHFYGSSPMSYLLFFRVRNAE
ncbi:MAG: hypothetical protein KY459_03910 [Acidobacteria bacterium]|nr:hypothetical protein [Acidobacteriota bacterium]